MRVAQSSTISQRNLYIQGMIEREKIVGRSVGMIATLARPDARANRRDRDPADDRHPNLSAGGHFKALTEIPRA